MEINDPLHRWRLILGGKPQGEGGALPQELQEMDEALSSLYDPPDRGGLGASSPKVHRWLGDIRKYFPSQVVSVMQKDAITRLGLTQMLLEPESLRNIEPDVNLVSTLISLNRVMPERVKETARQVVNKVVKELMLKLENPLRQAVTGALSRSVRNYRPRFAEIDWHQTIRANLRHYQHEYKTIVPQRLIGAGRKGQALKHVILCVDQSGSMASSVVYSSIAGAVLASIPALKAQMVVFDTAVVDLTQDLQDPVDLLFGVQLGGGTDIHKALTYCSTLVTRPQDTVLVLVSDLYEGGSAEGMLRKSAELVGSGVNMIALLALSDAGKPSYDHSMAARLAALGVPSFACTPDAFPDLMAAALARRDLSQFMEG